MNLPDASGFAVPIDNIMHFMLAVSAVFVLLVFALVGYLCFRYRAGSAASRKNPPQKSNFLEGSLAFMILAFGLVSFFWSGKLFYHMSLLPADSLHMQVFAKQWMWIFHTPEGADQINLLTVPVNKPVELVMISEDVIHSLFIPAFRVKQDVLPGRYTHMWFKADKVGEYPILCTQYCGLDHSRMRATVRVLSADDFAAYQKQARAQAEIALDAGSALFQKKACISCHNEGSKIAPSLRGVFGSQVSLANGRQVRADESYIRRSILNPSSQVVQGYSDVMPSFQGQLTEQELNSLISYVQSLATPTRQEVR